MRRGAATSSRAVTFHVGAPAGAKAASIARDRVTRRTAPFAAAAAPTLRRAAAPWSGLRPHAPGRGDILPSRDVSCRSAGRRESGVDRPQPRHPPHRPIRGCRRSYIAPSRGDMVRGRPHAPGRGDILPGRDVSCRSAGRRESGVDRPRPRHPPRRPIRGCRRSYIAPSRGDMVRVASACARARRHPPEPRRFM